MGIKLHLTLGEEHRLRMVENMMLRNGVRFLLGNSPASKVHRPTFQNTLFHLHRQVCVRRMN